MRDLIIVILLPSSVGMSELAFLLEGLRLLPPSGVRNCAIVLVEGFLDPPPPPVSSATDTGASSSSSSSSSSGPAPPPPPTEFAFQDIALGLITLLERGFPNQEADIQAMLVRAIKCAHRAEKAQSMACLTPRRADPWVLRV